MVDFLDFLPLILWIVWMFYCIIHWFIPSIIKKEKQEAAMSIAITLFFTTLFLNFYIETFYPLFSEVLFFQITGQLIMYFAFFIFIFQFFLMRRLGEGNTDWEDTTVLIKEAGWFRVMRHPMYFAGILCNIGTYFVKISWLSFFLPPISIFLCIMSAVWDEKISLEKFGEEYKEYMKKVKKFGIF